MCGSYIHGRSWSCREIEEAWYHVCDPMRINAHNEMEMPRMRYRLVSRPMSPITEADSSVTFQHMEYEKLEVLTVDWGIQPWDGKLCIQRINTDGGTPDGFLKSVRLKDFLPKTRTDLTKWTRAHWGKRNDAHEFLCGMSHCLNADRLIHLVPGDLRQITLQRSSQEARGDPILWENYEGSNHYKVVKTIERGLDPCDRFCEMFAEAPNAFWAERN